jgi:lipopolysaccharide biosynthesis glycosyltransferase
MRTLIVTAANEVFMTQLRGLIASLRQWEPRPFTDLACFDLGFTPASRAWVTRHAAHVVAPEWDLPVAASLRAEKPDLRAFTVRPFLPRYFPGYEVYLWIDADAWVQERFALEWYFGVAAEGPLAIVPHVDRAYRHTPDLVAWRTNRLRAYFGQEAGSQALWNMYFNSGVFALSADAPHWALWAKWFKAGLAATKGTLVCDQTALNHALWMEQLPVSPLPALCNWLCHLAPPAFDVERGRFCEPLVPRNLIGILHLSADTKNYSVELRGDGAARKISLCFPGVVSD